MVELFLSHLVNSKLKIVILGAGGRLGAALVREYAATCEVAGYNHAQLDLANLERLRETISNERSMSYQRGCPNEWGLLRGSSGRGDPIKRRAPQVPPKFAENKGARFIHVSSDYVFDGEKQSPYTEEDAANAISVYGESKSARGIRVLERTIAPWSFASPGFCVRTAQVLSCNFEARN
jgi:dTDP-4-dehydrorhamnose reductase